MPCARRSLAAIADPSVVGLDYFDLELDGSPYPVSVISSTSMAAPAIVALDGGGLPSSRDSGFAVALAEDGSVWVWGANDQGQLADGSRVDRATPGQLARVSNAVAIAAGADHGLALNADGLVWAWGDNSNGQLGLGDTAAREAPELISGLPTIISIAGGHGFSLAVDVFGSVWGWGSPQANILQNESQPSPTPVRISGLGRITAISAATSHALALDEDGDVWSWGRDVSEREETTPVVRFSGAIEIAARGSLSLALDSFGEVHSWGSNDHNALGREIDERGDCAPLIGGPPRNCTSVPGRVTGIGNIVQIEAGHGFAVTRDVNGRVFAWALMAMDSSQRCPALRSCLLSFYK